MHLFYFYDIIFGMREGNIMENNVELIKSLFVDIDPSIINNDKLDIKVYLKKL